jgi:hypothetical protein
MRDIHKLHAHFRNGFEHFQPQTWSIEKVGLPRIILTAVEFIEMAMASRTVEHRLTGNKTRRLRKNLAEARASLVGDEKMVPLPREACEMPRRTVRTILAIYRNDSGHCQREAPARFTQVAHNRDMSAT